MINNILNLMFIENKQFLSANYSSKSIILFIEI